MVALLAATCSAADRFEGFTEPVQIIDVAAPESGTISELLVKPGQAVRKGDVLAILDRDLFEAALEVARVKAQATARREAAEIQFRLKEKRLENIGSLNKTGFGSPEELDRARADVALARTELKAAEEELRLNQLEQKRIEVQVQRRSVRSPVNGVVVQVHRQPGEFVPVTEPKVATVVRLEQLRVKLYLPTAIATTLQSGRPLELELVDDQQTATSIIEFIAPITHAESGTVRVEVLLDNSRQQHRSGVRCVPVLPRN